MEQLIEDLRSQIQEGSALLLVGTGVSIASTRNPAAAWPELVRSGLRRAAEVNRGLPKDWKTINEQSLDMAIESDHVDSLLAAAEAVDAALRPSKGEYAAWLYDTVGSFTAQNTMLLSAIAALQLPILTTNYDTLLEAHTGYDCLDESNEAAIHRVIRSQNLGIVHLHGHWKRPGGVVLGVRSYERLLSATNIQELLKAAFLGRSVVLVGVGSGLHDPNFSALREWLSSHTSESPYRHYLLQTAGDATGVEVGADRIAPVVYGESYDDLVPFLEDLGKVARRAPKRLHSPAQRARLRLIDDIQASSLLRRETDTSDPRLEDLLIPPVLLPMPHEQYVSGLQGVGQSRPKRIDTTAYDGDPRVVIVVASDSGSGLTSSLAWLLTNARASRESTPVYLRSDQLTQGTHPLLKPVRAFLREVGHDEIGMNYEHMPSTVVAIDDYSMPRDDATTVRLIKDLSQPAIHCAFFGCREGREADLYNRLSTHGMNAAVWYVGRFGDRDVERLAALVAEDAPMVARQISEILVREQLPRKPVTLCILLLAVLRHSQLADSMSETDLLDEFASILLGRDSPFQDSRYELGYRDKEDILGYLAERFVRENKWSLPEDKVLMYVQDCLSAMTWREDALQIVQDLLARRVLVVRQGTLAFHDAPFLYLFAAKHAQRDHAFLGWLKEKPFVYGPILRHYAALARSDSHLLSIVSAALEELLSGYPVGPFFAGGEADDGETAGLRAAILGLTDEGADGAGESENTDGTVASDARADVGESETLEADEDLPLGFLEFTRSEPAPFDVDGTISVLALSHRVHFVSQVVRDSVSVSDPQLKRRSLVQVLRGWGRVAADVAQTPAFRELAEKIVEEVASKSVNARAKLLSKDIADAFPVWLIMAGMDSSLASTKVVASVEEVFQESRGRDAECAAVAGLLVLVVRDPGWVGIATQTYWDFSDVRHMERALFPILMFLYLFGEAGREGRALEDFLLDALGYGDAGRRGGIREHGRQRLRQTRLVNQSAIGSREDVST